MFELNNINQIEDDAKYVVNFQYEEGYVQQKLEGYELKYLFTKIGDTNFLKINNLVINLRTLYFLEWKISDEDGEQ